MRPVKNSERPPDEKTCEKVSQIEAKCFLTAFKKKKKINITNLMLQIDESSFRIMGDSLPRLSTKLNCNLAE